MTEERPEVTLRGPGDSVAVVVGGIHGDEPGGVEAMRRVRDSFDYRRGVKYVVANPVALERGVRFLDADMNRVFPGDPESGDLERRLAAAVCRETAGLPALALHSTVSSPEPFALVAGVNRDVLEIASLLPVRYVVDESRITDGSYTQCSPVVSVEVGCQDTDGAVETAERLIEAFLQATDAVAGEPSRTDTTYLSVVGAVPKEEGVSYEVVADNFSRVEEGEVYARTPEGELRAEEAFVPVLMSSNGYTDILGFKAVVAGDSLEEAAGEFAAN